jgi:cytochrome c oxidase subunit 2
MTSLLPVAGDSPSTLDPSGSEAHHLANAWWIMFALAVMVYVVVGGLIVIASLRGRRRGRAAVDAPARSDDYFIWIGGLGVPVLILAFMAFLTVHTGAALRAPARNALQIDVVGHQWWWEVSYPGTSVVTANEIHVPVGQPLEFHLDSADVVHSFWVPELAGKEDLIPGQHNVHRFTVDRPGVYRGVCAEFCGLEHAKMGMRVIALSAGDFAIWMQHEQHLTDVPSSELAARGELAFTANACAGCHTVRGTDATGTVGPDLSDVGARARIGAETLDNTKSNLFDWIKDPGQAKRGSRMPPATLSDDDITAIVAYLEDRK